MGARLLPPWAKWVGAAALGLGAALAVVRFGFGLRPAWLELPVFAAYSAYFEVKRFTVITKNVTDELLLLLSFGGLAAIALSRERDETEALGRLRGEALLLALKLNVALLALAVLTLFGVGFVYALVANVYALLLLYVVVFHARRRALRAAAPMEAAC